MAHLGKTRLVADLDPQDFAALRNNMAKKWGPHRLAVTIQHIRSIFKHAFDAGRIPTPVRFGPGFKRPTKKTFRLHRAEQGPKLFTAEEIRRLHRRRRHADEGDDPARDQLRLRQWRLRQACHCLP